MGLLYLTLRSQVVKNWAPISKLMARLVSISSSTTARNISNFSELDLMSRVNTFSIESLRLELEDCESLYLFSRSSAPVMRLAIANFVMLLFS